jgi:nitrate/nitrite transporter NarK
VKLSNISGSLYIISAILAIVFVAALTATETAKVIKLKLLENELSKLKEEKNNLIIRSIYSIKFTDVAIHQQAVIKRLQDKILEKKGLKYE